MAQYQPYGKTYWHGGCDLRVKAGAPVKTPVDGRLEAGHYSYAVKSDGSMEKYWKAWPKAGEALYFEVAVVADDGTRYEFHHVNRKNLPKRIVDILNSGGRVSRGEVVGYTIPWSDGVYHHIHYNVIKPNGVQVNPEYVSELVTDRLAPQVKSIHAVLPSGAVESFGSGEFTVRPREFVVEVIDKKDGNVYDHPPTTAALIFWDGSSSGWDFTKYLLKPDGKFPALWDYFVKSLRTPSGNTLKTTGGYGKGVSLVRLEVPKNATGGFRIELGDIAGNVTSYEGTIPEEVD